MERKEQSVWLTRMRWRMRGAWLWPAFIVLTLAEGVALQALPIAGDGPGGVVPGVLLAGFTGTGQEGIGDSYLFTSLAAVLVGGTSLVGARGDYWRTVLGALILTLITTLLVGHGADESTQEILIGVLILVFVGVYGRDQRVRDRV